MRSSLQEVARRAGVSNGTVSRVLNNINVKIAPETRQRVQQVADELGYQPNRAARWLVTGRSQSIGLCVATVHSPHAMRVISEAMKTIRAQNFDVLVNEVHVLPNGQVDTPRLHALPVDGMIFSELPHGRFNDDLEAGHLWGKPVVCVGVYVLDYTDHVKLDLYPCAVAAVHHLHDIGCKRIGYLVPNMFDWYQLQRDDRLRAYETAIAEIGQAPEFIRTESPARAVAGAPLRAHIEQHGCPDGLFCYNDEMAVAALQTLREMGLRVPEDVALVGCDGIEESAYHHPALSTIVMPIREMFVEGWQLLTRRIESPELPLQQVVVQPRLEIRGSSRR